MYYNPLPIIAPFIQAHLILFPRLWSSTNSPFPRAVRSGMAGPAWMAPLLKAGEARPSVILHVRADEHGHKIRPNLAAFRAETFSTTVHPYYPIDGWERKYT